MMDPRCLLVICLCVVSSAVSSAHSRVMARAVPERKDDFVFENEMVCYRIYGRALEPRPTSPGIDVWVKLPGRLVADEWYAASMEDHLYYHHDHGGKDCYETGRSFGAGASSPLVDGHIAYPATNYRSYEVVQSTPSLVVFTLHYPEWECEGTVFALDKTFTVEAGSRFVRVDDLWHISGRRTEADIMAGIFLHPSKQTVENIDCSRNDVVVWERASDTKHEPEDGMIGLAVVMPDADTVAKLPDGSHAGCIRRVSDGEHMVYYISSAWSRGGILSYGEWMREIRRFRKRLGR